MSSPIVIRQVVDPEELEALYRFRYSVYVEEMQRFQVYADHHRKRIEDPLDRTGCNLAAWIDGRIVGCVRSNLSRDGGLGAYHAMLRMENVPAGDFPGTTSLCTRLMLCSGYRNSSLLARLFAENYKFGLRAGIKWTFLDCNDHLVEMFARLGFERTHLADHPEYGLVNAMRLELLDLEHLKASGSMFAPILKRHLAQSECLGC